MNAVTEAINKAKESAADLIDDAEVIEQTLPAVNGEAPITVNTSKPSMEVLAASAGIGSSVDTWLKVSEFGLSIGADKKPTFEELVMEIDMTEGEGFYVKEMIKWGNPVNYASRYDGNLTDKGEPWAEVVARARRMDDRAKVFPSADLILRSTSAIKLKESTLPAGTILGHTLSMSNWGNWTEFYRECAKNGLIGQTVKVKVIAEEVNSKSGYTWGVCQFQIVTD